MRRVGTLLCLLILPGLILAAAATRDHSIQPAEQAPSPAPQAALAPIPWRSGAASATAKTPSQIHNALTALLAPSGPLRGAPAPQHVVVQFDRPPAPARRAALHNHGITLLAPLGGNAFFAAVSPARLNPQALTDLTSLKDVRPIDPLRKLHPLLPADSLLRVEQRVYRDAVSPLGVGGELPGEHLDPVVLGPDAPLVRAPVRTGVERTVEQRVRGRRGDHDLLLSTR